MAELTAASRPAWHSSPPDGNHQPAFTINTGLPVAQQPKLAPIVAARVFTQPQSLRAASRSPMKSNVLAYGCILQLGACPHLSRDPFEPTGVHDRHPAGDLCRPSIPAFRGANAARVWTP